MKVTAISVIIPAFNAETTLRKAVESVQSQTFQDYELILVDDGSRDGTASLLDSLARFPEIVTIGQDNQGVSAARNAGAKLAQGDWLVFLDADDVLISNALELLCSFTEDAHITLIRGGFIRELNEEKLVTLPDGKCYTSPLVGSFALRRSVFLQVGGYDEEMKFSENTELFHRLALAQVGIAYIPEPLFIYKESAYGGSRNLRNMIDSIERLLGKHQATLTAHSKFLFNRVLGVNYTRKRDYKNAKRCFLNAFRQKPWRIDTLLRYGIASIPVLARNLYKPNL